MRIKLLSVDEISFSPRSGIVGRVTFDLFDEGPYPASVSIKIRLQESKDESLASCQKALLAEASRLLGLASQAIGPEALAALAAKAGTDHPNLDLG